NEPGVGVTATIDQRVITVGAVRSTGYQPVQSTGDQRHGLVARATGTVVEVAENSADHAVIALGLIELTDELKPDSVDAVRALHAMGLRTVLLTGDNRATADAIAKQVGIDDVRAEVKPAEKAKVIRELQRELTIADHDASNNTLTRRQHPKVAMIGDGIND